MRESNHSNCFNGRVQDCADWFGIDSLQASVRLISIAREIVPIGLAFIVYKLVSMLTSIAREIVPIGLALIVYKLVSS